VHFLVTKVENFSALFFFWFAHQVSGIMSGEYCVEKNCLGLPAEPKEKSI